MVISVIGIIFCCQLYLRRLGPSPYLQPTRERESESESDSADTEVAPSLLFYVVPNVRVNVFDIRKLFALFA